MIKICENPSVQAYAHHAYVTAFIEGAIAEDEEEGLMRLEILNAAGETWMNPSNIPNEGNSYWINEKEKDMYRFVFRECKDSDEMIVRIDSLQNKVKNSILNFAITGDDFEKCINENNNSYKSGYLYNRILTRYNEMFITDQSVNQKEFRFFKLCKNGKEISCWVSADAVNWEIVEKDFFEISGEKFNIGFIVENLADLELRKQYEAWLFSNYIQFKYDDTDAGFIWLDYWNFPKKNAMYETRFAENFLEIVYEEPSEIVDLTGELITYIDWCIDHNYGICVNLDEFYLEGRTSYQKEHHFHHNLFYAKNKEDEYCIIGYDQKLTFGTITKETFLLATKKMQGRIMKYRFQPNIANKLTFRIESVVESLDSFLKGTANEKYYTNIMSDNGKYGVDALKQLKNSDNGKDILIGDKRVGFLLFEYSELMYKRLQYLHLNGYIKDERIDQLTTGAELIVELSKQLKNLVVKNLIKPRYEEDIIQLYDEWYENLLKFILELRENIVIQ